jgi:hypothetical protein
VTRGYERLTAIARGAEALGKPELALLAWQAERAAVLESAALSRPFPERLEEANRNLARLTAAKTVAESERTAEAQRLFQQAQSQHPERPPWGALLTLGLLLCALGVGGFAALGLPAEGGVAWARGRWSLLAFLAGAALWALSAYHG